MAKRAGIGRVAALNIAVLCALAGVSNTAVANEQEQFVPADTLFYFGTGNSIPAEHMLSLMPTMPIPPTSGNDALAGALQAYFSFFENPQEKLPEWGIDTDLQNSVYSVGLMPVMRLALKDAKKFETAMDAFETEQGINSVSSTREEVSLRFFSTTEISRAGKELKADLEKPAADNPSAKEPASPSDTAKSADSALDSGAGILVANDGQDLIVSFITDYQNRQLVDSVTGIAKPAKNIVDTGKLKQLRKKWAYGDEAAGFLDLRQIAATLINNESPASKELEALIATDKAAQAQLAMLRSEPCQSEVASLAESWPMVVFGARQFDVTEKEVIYESHMAAVLKHELLRDTLMLLKGVLPTSQSAGRPMLSLGVGVTVDKLAQVVGQFTQLLGAVNYRCQPLTGLNALASADLSAASMGVVMFGGLARGVQGLSLNIFDVEMDPAAPRQLPANVDTAIALSAADPALLIQTLKMMPQMGMLGELPLDGTEMLLNPLLPIPVPGNVEIKAAVKGKNIVIYSGEKGTDYANRLGGSDTEGFFQSTIDTALILDKASAAIGASGAKSEDTDMILNILESYPRGSINYKVDFTEEGVEILGGGSLERQQPAGK